MIDQFWNINLTKISKFTMILNVNFIKKICCIDELIFKLLLGDV